MPNDLKRILEQIEEIKNAPPIEPVKVSVDEGLPARRIKMYYGQESIPDAAERMKNVSKNEILHNYINKKYDLNTPYIGDPEGLYLKYNHRKPLYNSKIQTIIGNNEHVPHVLARELGSLIQAKKRPNFASIVETLRQGGRRMLGTTIGGALLLNDETAPYAGIGMAAPYIPGLVREYQVNKKALDLLKEVRYARDVLDTSKKSLRLTSRQALRKPLIALGGGTGLGLLVKYLPKLSDQHDIEKTASIFNEIKTISNTLAKAPKPSLPSLPSLPSFANTAKGIGTMNIGGKPITGQMDLLQKLNFADQNMFRHLGKHINITSGYRSFQEQQNLVNRLGNGRPIPGIVAPPGKSVHNVGAAFDIANWQEAQPFLNQAGFVNPLANDRVHFRPSNFQNEGQIINYYRKGLF